jgi:nitrite reductase/ring-hydroxylating ferredoxin subunit/uncharacterized membrane protein
MIERYSRILSGFGDGLANVLKGFYRALGAPGKLLQDFLNGSWLGHPLHAVLTDVVVGGYTMLIALDLLGLVLHVDVEPAGIIILGLSTLAGLSAVLSGLTDYQDTATGDERNVTVLHGTINLIAIVVYIVAFAMRLGGSLDGSRFVAIVAYLIISVGAYIGGHVVFKYGYMVNHNAFARGKRPKEFTAILPAAELADGKPTKAMLGATALVLVRRGDLVHALKETCSHAGGPLSEGELRGDAIICPWHASQFRLADGRVLHGPAGTRQIRYRARITAGQVEVQGPLY